MFTYLTKFIFVIIIAIASTHAYIFSYTFAERLLAITTKFNEKLEDVANTYRYMHEDLMKYSNELKTVIDISNTYSDIGEFLSDPIHTFKLIKLLSKDYQKLQNSFTGKHAMEFAQVMEGVILTQNLVFPTTRDLIGVCHGIIRLQDVYRLNKNDMIGGYLKNYWNGSLKYDDLEELKNCYNYHKTFDVGQWVSSDIKNDESSDLNLLLREYYYVLRAFYAATKITTGKALNYIERSGLYRKM